MNNQELCLRRIPLSLTLILSFIAIWHPTSAFAQTPPPREAGSSPCPNKPNRAAQNWILKQIAAGNVADLSEKFPLEADRVLSASFLQGLLTNSLRGAKVDRQGVNIAHAVVCEAVDLDNAEVPFDTSLNDCYFKDNVSLYQSHFRKSLLLKNTIFAGYVNASHADIGMSFNASGAQFKQEANFNSAKVEQSAFVVKTIFEGPVNFGSAEIGPNLEADDAQFKNSQQDANFNSIKVGHTALFSRAMFAGGVDFGSAEIGSNLEADDAQFKDSQQGANFNSIKVGHTVVFRRAMFEGAVDFVAAEIGGSFEANDSKFKSSEKQADFRSVRVKLHAFFVGAMFEAPVDFSRAEIGGDFDASGAQFKNDKQSTSFGDMKVDAVKFDNATFAQAFDLDGLTYHSINTRPWNDLLDFIKQSEFSVDVYTKLEAFFLEHGYQDRANEVYIAQRRRERSERLRGFPWAGSLLLDGLVGYGRRPWLAFLWSVGFITLGWLVFRQTRNMVPQKKEYYSRTYNAFWYSIDLFLPVVQLEAASIWMPDPDYRFAWYANVHRILGWILIPIGLAAVTGIIK
jgi:hypothetical protein